jgi:hypothetical protein
MHKTSELIKGIVEGTPGYGWDQFRKDFYLHTEQRLLTVRQIREKYSICTTNIYNMFKKTPELKAVLNGRTYVRENILLGMVKTPERTQ